MNHTHQCGSAISWPSSLQPWETWQQIEQTREQLQQAELTFRYQFMRRMLRTTRLEGMEAKRLPEGYTGQKPMAARPETQNPPRRGQSGSWGPPRLTGRFCMPCPGDAPPPWTIRHVHLLNLGGPGATRNPSTCNTWIFCRSRSGVTTKSDIDTGSAKTAEKHKVNAVAIFSSKYLRTATSFCTGQSPAIVSGLCEVCSVCCFCFFPKCKTFTAESMGFPVFQLASVFDNLSS
ncbi:uncharacterized protein LOC109501251 isoform X3 [Felis catus]|uniref:uncharacterized protein LOC109501251 isoform X3 n=1 Tax=Felis catus TaxID=9685 RepID=UPI001D199D3D|nr:uncharacterized protein LOC109501251 isoform X3 [Felis catus]